MSVVSGRLFITASASHIKVLNAVFLQECGKNTSHGLDLPFPNSSHVAGCGSIEFELHPVTVHLK